MGDTSFCTGVPSTCMPSSNKIQSFRGNSAEITKMRHSPLRTMYPVPNRRYQEVEIVEKYV